MTLDAPLKTIAVVRGSSGAEVADVFRMLADKWQSSLRLAGLVAESHDLPDRTCTAGYLRNLATEERFQIFLETRNGATVCHLNGKGVLAAGNSVQHDIAAGCDLVLLSKFGKLEAGGKGLFGAFKAAVASHIPLLTSVSPSCEKQWQSLAGPSFAILPADADKIETWRQAL